ncbi:DinB family protein [Chitinophaga sp.]|uniref:DinB family protein n=1 Tax=Chitinophaga sp. TaxID=1869181 RepID=UPI002D80976D|nr:DinB family protein [Chitinophaga sp.]
MTTLSGIITYIGFLNIFLNPIKANDSRRELFFSNKTFHLSSVSPIFYSLLEIWYKSSADIKTLVDSYPEDNYLQTVSFKCPRNSRMGQMMFGQTVAHVINHSTYHRGQLVTLLRQTGFINLPFIDMATYFQLNKN